MFSQNQRLLEVKTPLGADVLVIESFSGSEFVSGLFRFNLDLLGEEGTEVNLKALPGKSVSVSMRDGDEKRFFHGIVSKARSGSRDERFRHFHAEVVPWLWLLTLKTNCRIFQDKTVVEIIQAVFDELKQSFPEVSYRDATSGSHIPLDYCVQYGETDFNFVSRMMEHEGIFYYFEHGEDQHTLVFADAASAIQKCPGKSQVLYREGGIGEREGIITHWQQDHRELSGKYSLRDHQFQLPTKSLEVNDQAKDSNGKGGLEFYDYPGEFTARFNKPEQRLGLVEKEGANQIRVLMEEQLLDEVLSGGRSNRPNLRAGYKFSLTKHFSCDGDYILDEVHHSASQSPDYLSNTASGAPYQNTFVCLPAAVHLRPRRVTPKPVIPGPQTAVVAMKSGEESWLDKFGRVRVQFFWDREGKDNESSTCWIRVAQKWAGAGWGAHFWPRVGQEVVVEFLEGDPDRPLITGSIYNTGSMPPYPLPDNYTRSGIITESSKYNSSTNFNELRFEDKMGQEQVFINAERDMDWRVENDHREFVGRNRDLIVKAAQTEIIEANKHEHVKAEHLEKVDGNASREIGGDDKERIAGKLSLKVLGSAHQKTGSVYTLEASDEIHLKSDQKIVIDSLRTSVKSIGGFVDIGPSGIAIQGMTVNINSGGSAGTGTAASPDPPEAPGDAKVAEDVTARVGRAVGAAIGASTAATPSGATQRTLPTTVSNGADAIVKSDKYEHCSEAVKKQIHSKDFTDKEKAAVSEVLKKYKSLMNCANQPLKHIGRTDKGISKNGSCRAETDTMGEWFEDSGTVVLTDAASNPVDFGTADKQFRGTLAHEIAHSLLNNFDPHTCKAYADSDDNPVMQDFHKAAGWNADGTILIESRTDKAPTSYARTNDEEDLSESMMLYMYDPDKLKSASPARFEFCKKLLGDK